MENPWFSGVSIEQERTLLAAHEGNFGFSWIYTDQWLTKLMRRGVERVHHDDLHKTRSMHAFPQVLAIVCLSWDWRFS
jgi:hypothetical protein